MKIQSTLFSLLFIIGGVSFSAMGQTQSAGATAAIQISPDVKAKSDTDIDKKAVEWATFLNLNDKDKEARVSAVIAIHLKAVRDWNNEHPYTTVPAGIDPATGKPLNQLERQVIANSAIPKTVHQDLMAGLRKDLTEEQVEVILDKYTEGKVAFTLNGYKAIVPDLTPTEEAAILVNLKQAREQAIDFKGSKQISTIFEIYKTKNEQYLNTNGRNWHKMYGDYTNMIKAKKAAEAAAKQAGNQ
ncbi:DUF3826 domain-containing protein [Mucilaginibacter sp.]|uniref:DUF3826 domain-containing protein n=1 Tax=Mucilaginibacter sp. TaxID=1882438 RepID=UPI002606E6F0|nr:DUF3826 domain-containing protein [Mucilaginibacter sp.]MDB4919565.1 hypothetical protein [Mucilaginibacter sp.]